MSFGGRNGSSMDAGRIAPIDRQITQLLSGEDAVSNLRFTTLLQEVGSSSSSSKSIDYSQEFNKLFIRIRQLLQGQKEAQLGLLLAAELAQSIPWQKIVAHCSEWINAALVNFNKHPKESIAILDSVLGSEARQQPEYWRNVGSAGSTKYSLILMESIEQAIERKQDHLPVLLNALVNQINLHPTSFRSHAPRIQKICFELLFSHQICVTQATRLLAKLPFTGKGREGQMDLWSATLRLLLRDAKMAWEACSSAFLPTSDLHQQGNSVFPQAHPGDDVAYLRIAHSRLALLLGSTPKPGILAIFLSEPSPGAVKVPTEEILALAHSILSLHSSSATRLDHAPEVILHATQAALLPRAHICAITFLASLPASIWQRGYGEAIQKLIIIAEKSSAVVRCTAFNALANMPMVFNPHAPLLARCTRTCLAQLARLVTQSESEAKDMSGNSSVATSTNGANSRANKKRRTYEADQVLFKPLEGLKVLSEDEQAACAAAVRLLSNKLYENLIPFVSPQSHDLAQSSCVLLLGVLELALRESQGEQMIQQFVSSLARMVSLSRGPLLGVLTTRASTLCAEAMNHPSRSIQAAAETLRIALCDTFHPKLPPKLSLRLHVDEDRQEISNETEEKQLEEVTLDEDRGKSEQEIMRDVLDIVDDGGEVVQQQTTKATLFPRTSNDHPSEQTVAANVPYSPDPVKPIRRPSTPRIGSPKTSLRHDSQSPERTSGFKQAPSYSLPSKPSAINATTSAEDGTLSHLPTTLDTSSSTVAIASTTTSKVSSPLAKQGTMSFQDDDGEDSDDSMPALDIRSSDEEDDEEE
ncbi:uncharacterized protein FA14DRAFT_162682 [Meira miltonrushii]|uniref:Pre-rRNA-processing protein RIX1 N-terminal domain-containing protein n=1 Tax=Meira miltonrushii TaxID=1280837 RepID=A0A316V2S1_9BASI|nr:uncharacterized protein FA14DRAFT_162682 [Meira miltonrushii]PWN31820.1 hypothetical protein FA14DRAFT_162682 [Meira miltonrushii]